MRSLYSAVTLLVLSLALGTAYLRIEKTRLDRFCDALPLGAGMPEVRKLAQRSGFEPKIEPFAQMRIEPRFWHLAKPYCRVVFNADRVVEFRISQAD